MRESIRHFKHLVSGERFVVYTDHKPLTTALLKAGEPWSDRQRNHLAEIAEAGAELRYTKGKDNVVADALSRCYISAVSPDGIDYNRMATLQQIDGEIAQYRTAITGLQWSLVERDGIKLWCDTSTGRARPLVPAVMRRLVTETLHALSHPSISATTRLVAERFIWHGLKRDVRQWTRECQQCQRNKVTRHTKPTMGVFSEPSRRFKHVHVDVTGPLPISRGMKYIFTMVDRSTRWCEAVPMPDQTTTSCAAAFIERWISRFGVPEHVTSDQGAVFTSAIWTSLSKTLGTHHHHTTSYHPASNGLVERFHRDLKASLRARCTDSQWVDQLPWVLLGLRTVAKEPLGTSAAEMVYGENLAVPGEFWPSPSDPDDAAHRELQRARATAETFTPTPPKHHVKQTAHVPAALSTCDFVFLRDDRIKPALSPPYVGPFRVLRRCRNTYQLQMGNSKRWHTINRLKPAYLAEDKITRSGRTSHAPDRLQAA